ncbi:MAG: histidinol-phosphate transaminase [Candidatus Omnitrophota bacterium]|nr:histidinol-phosphate transaminase [Candidatus Omnitrophota bacterium]
MREDRGQMIRNLVRKNILGIKPYEPGKPVEELKRELNISNIVKLASNENPLGPSKKAIKAMREAASNVNRYPDGNCYYLKQALSRYLNVSPENLIIGNGSNEIIELAMKTFVDKNEEVIISEPSFLIYNIACRAAGGSPVIVPLKDFRTDLNAIKDSITDKTKLIFIDNPNNPTGGSVGEMEVEAFMEKLPGNVIVVFDEAYNEFVEREDFPDTIRYIGRKNIIILRTFSKAHGLSGLRIGYGIAEEETVRLMNRSRQPFNVNSMAQAAAIASIEDKKHITKSKAAVCKGKRLLYEELDSMELDYVRSDTNFILIDVKRDGKDVFENMLKEGVIVRDMKAYKLDSYIRVTIGTMPENRRFVTALRKVLSAPDK